MASDYDDWEKQRRALTPLFNSAILLMLKRGIAILENSQASYKTSDATRLISTARELQESLRPLSESERAVEMLGVAGSAIRSGLLPESTVEIVHDKLNELKAELAKFERASSAFNERRYDACNDDFGGIEID